MRSSAGFRLIAVVLVIAAIVAAIKLPIGAGVAAVTEWALANPVKGAFVYLFAATVGGVIMTPGWIPMMLAGLVFGIAKGIPLAALGIVAGATAAFLVSRVILRDAVERQITGHPMLLAIDRAVVDRGFVIVMLTRLAVLLPYNLLNYAYGATQVSLATYVFATGVGMLPVITLYVYLGTLAVDVGQMLDGGGSPPAGAWWISAAALVAVALVTIIVQRAARRALAEQVVESERDTEEGAGTPRE